MTREADQLRENDGAGDALDIPYGDINDWCELKRVGKGIMPTGFVEIDVFSRGSETRSAPGRTTEY